MGIEREYVVVCPSLKRAEQLTQGFVKNYKEFISEYKLHSFKVLLKGDVVIRFVSEATELKCLRGIKMSESEFIAKLRAEHNEDILV